MFKKLILFVFAFAFFNNVNLSAAGQFNSNGITWLTNYEEALSQSKASSKPILLLFTGSDWCSWCHKLEEEVLSTPQFAQTAGDAFIFVKLDFPLYSQQDPQVKAQNKQLQSKFAVRSFPTIVLVDGQQNQQIGMTGYRPGGDKQYAGHLSKMVSDYAAYKQKMGALDKSKNSGNELKMLFEKAKELKLDNDASTIVKQGIKSDKSLYFLTEQYRSFVDEGRIQDKEAVALRQQLLSTDPNNENQTHYQVALIDFKAACDQMEAENLAAESIVAPLVEYINKFGTKDKENVWRMQMIISQVYLDKNQMSKALMYAQSSYESAPSSVQPDIARAVTNIKSQVTTAIH